MSAQQDPQSIDDQFQDQIVEQFVQEAHEIIDHLNLCLIQLDQDLKDSALIQTVKRDFHTLKGSSGFAELDQLSLIAKTFEMLMADVLKGDVALTTSAVNLMYEGLDSIAVIVDKAKAKDFSRIEPGPLIEKVEMLKAGRAVESQRKADSPQGASAHDFKELFNIYQEGYNQLVALKHLIFSSIHLSDPETLAAILSKQIHERMGPIRNSIWLVVREEHVVEIARDGRAVEPANRRILKSDRSEVLQRVLHEQLIVWPMDAKMIQEELAEYQSPVIFPIKMKTSVLGLLILDPEEKAEIELYQFITQFAAMVMSIAQLHHKVEEQRTALDEMSGILFKQNAQLSALYHVEMELIQEKDPVKLCGRAVKAVVNDLDAKKAAVFLYRQIKKEFFCAAQFGGLEKIVGQNFPLTAINALQQSLETGRLIAYIESGEALCIGPHQIDNWIVLSIKGRERIHGVMVVEIGDEDISDAISILTNYLGTILDNVILYQQIKRDRGHRSLPNAGIEYNV